MKGFVLPPLDFLTTYQDDGALPLTPAGTDTHLDADARADRLQAKELKLSRVCVRHCFLFFCLSHK